MCPIDWLYQSKAENYEKRNSEEESKRALQHTIIILGGNNNENVRLSLAFFFYGHIIISQYNFNKIQFFNSSMFKSLKYLVSFRSSNTGNRKSLRQCLFHLACESKNRECIDYLVLNSNHPKSLAVLQKRKNFALHCTTA